MPTADAPIASPDAGRSRETEQLARVTVEVRSDGTSCHFQLAKGLTFAEATKHVLTARDAITAEVDARMDCPASPKVTPPDRAAAAGGGAPTFGPRLEMAVRAYAAAKESRDQLDDEENPDDPEGISHADALLEADHKVACAWGDVDCALETSAARTASRAAPGGGTALTVEALAEALYETDSYPAHWGKRLSWAETVSAKGAASLFASHILGPHRARAAAILARLSPAAVPGGPADRLREAARGLAGAAGRYQTAVTTFFGFVPDFVTADSFQLEEQHYRAEIVEADLSLHAAVEAQEKALASAEADGGFEPSGKTGELPPYGQEVEVRAGKMRFRAALMRGASVDAEGASCDQWQATREGEHPPSWTDGACWESNADLSPSLQVEAWRFAPPAPASTGEQS